MAASAAATSGPPIGSITADSAMGTKLRTGCDIGLAARRPGLRRAGIQGGRASGRAKGDWAECGLYFFFVPWVYLEIQ